MVYVVDAQDAATKVNVRSKRNTLFTAVTRSRAWVRISGFGADMSIVEAEIRSVIESDFKLNFAVPTPDQQRQLNQLYRDRPAAEEEAVRKVAKALTQGLEAIESGDIDLDDLPPALRTRLALLLTSQADSNEEFDN